MRGRGERKGMSIEDGEGLSAEEGEGRERYLKEQKGLVGGKGLREGKFCD